MLERVGSGRDAPAVRKHVIAEFGNFELGYLEVPVIVYYTVLKKPISPILFAGPVVGFSLVDNSYVVNNKTVPFGIENLEYGMRLGAGFQYKPGALGFRLEYLLDLTWNREIFQVHGFRHTTHALSFGLVYRKPPKR